MFLWLIALVIGCAALPANAALISVTGPNFTVSFDDAQAGYAFFGRPTVAWNTVFFTPSDYVAESLNGEGSAGSSVAFSFHVDAVDGIGLFQLLTSDRGDYRLSGDGSSVSVTGSVHAFSESISLDANLVVSPGTPLDVADGALKPWLAMGALNLEALSRSGFTDSASITLTRTLTAFTVPGVEPSLAFIQQKFAATRIDFQLRPTAVTPVPAPDSLVLVCSALGTLVLGTQLQARCARSRSRLRRSSTERP
jgi:hypothetical protein